jgi:2-hydroxychromene-2-carboxylate isomerase
MSLKSLLMPLISQRLLSREAQAARHARAERQRVGRSDPHRVHYFHQIDDPYSVLAAHALPALVERYDIRLTCHLVGPPPDDAAPDRARLVAHSRRDAALLARHHGMAFTDPGRQPDDATMQCAGALLVAAIARGQATSLAADISAAAWQPEADAGRLGAMFGSLNRPPGEVVEAHVNTANALRRQLGHYLGATFCYGGEWYWGIDRLYHLERRLQALGAARDGATDLLYPPDDRQPAPAPRTDAPAIDFYFSLRSPYSAIVAERVFQLGRLTGAPVRLRWLLPMVMRGLAVPASKRRYIASDAAREAHARGIAFGRINDPVGQPAERGLALVAFADAQGRGEDMLRSLMHGVWAEGLDAGSDRGLARMAERAGMTWQDCQAALADASWRDAAARHREALLDRGLWGVPSFAVADLAVWGQDRLWAVRDEVLRLTG